MWNQQPYFGNQHSASYAPRYNPYTPRHSPVSMRQGVGWAQTYPVVQRLPLMPPTNAHIPLLEPPPPPPPPETPSSPGSQLTAMKQEHNTHAKTWVRPYSEVPQPRPSAFDRQPQPHPEASPPRMDMMNPERKTSTTPSDLPSPQMSAHFFDRDPRTRKRRDSNSLPVTAPEKSVESTVDPNDVTLETAGLNKYCEPAEKKGRKTLEMEDRQKRSNIGEIVGSHFETMKAHYKKEAKKLADKCNELKKINGKLRQEKDEQQQQYELSVQKMKRDVDNAERSIKEGLQDKITRLENALRATQETLERRQEAELAFQAEHANRLRKCEEDKETLRRRHHEHVESYLSKVDKLNREKDVLCADNVVQRTKLEQLTAQLDDSKREVVELREALTDRDTTVDSQKKAMEQLEHTILALRQQVRHELLTFIERMEQTL